MSRFFKPIRVLLAPLGLLWVFLVLLAAFGYLRIGRWITDAMGWSVHDTHLRNVPWLASKASWLAYWLIGGCRIEMHYPTEQFRKPGLHVVLCDHPPTQLETPIIWIIIWRIARLMVGSFDAGHVKYHPFAWGMRLADMDLLFDREHRKQRDQLSPEAYQALARRAQSKLAQRLQQIDRLAGGANTVIILHLFVTSRWKEERHQDDLLKFGDAIPSIRNWGDWVLMPQAGGFHVAREHLTNVSGWYHMVVTRQNPRGSDNWRATHHVVGAHYQAYLEDVTDRINALPLTQEASAAWLAGMFAPWACQHHVNDLGRD